MLSVPLPIVTVVLAVIAATVTDLRAFRIYNVLTLPLVATGLAYHAYFGEPGAFVNSLYGAAFGFGSLLGFYLLGGMGGGDVKLMTGVGAWLGLPLTFVVFVAAALAAGCYALVLTLLGGQFRETCIRLQVLIYRATAVGRHLAAEDKIEAEVIRDDRRRRLIPFAAMMMVGLVAMIILVQFRVGTPLASHP